MTTPIVPTVTDELIAELEVSANAATPGPWNYDGSYVCTMRQEDGTIYVESWNPIADALLTKNVHYIAKANPATILALLQHVRELRADAERLDSLDKLCEAYGFEGVHEGNRWVIDGPFRSIRDAIDSLPDDAARSSAD